MSPQLEQGYTRIADAILEKVAKTKLNGTQFRILMIVWRSTYGWQKKDHELSLSYLVKATEINKRQIQRELNNMIELGILTEVKAPTFNTSRVIGFNKNYVKSTQVSRRDTGDVLDTSTDGKLDTSTGGELDTQNKELNKQYNKDHENAIKMNSDFDVERVWKAYPNKKGKKDSFKKIPKILKLMSANELIALINKYDKTVYDKKYLMHGSTFFNGRYEDYIEYKEEQKQQSDGNLQFKDLSEETIEYADGTTL